MDISLAPAQPKCYLCNLSIDKDELEHGYFYGMDGMKAYHIECQEVIKGKKAYNLRFWNALEVNEALETIK